MFVLRITESEGETHLITELNILISTSEGGVDRIKSAGL